MNINLIQNRKYRGSMLFVICTIGLLFSSNVSATSTEIMEAPIGTKYHFTTTADQADWKVGDEEWISVTFTVDSFGEGAEEMDYISMKLYVYDSNEHRLHFGFHDLNNMKSPGAQAISAKINLVAEEDQPEIKYFNISASIEFYQDKFASNGFFEGSWRHNGDLVRVAQVYLTSTDDNGPLSVPVWTFIPAVLIPILIRKK